jgi:hypothetical protein
VIEVAVGAAIVAGLIAGAIMEGPVYLQKAMGLPVKQNIFRTWGNMFGLRGGGGYAAGMIFHEILAAGIAILYALFFKLIGVEGNLWLWGLVGALIHYALAGPVVKMLPSIDPETDEVGTQGFAYRNYGALDVVTSFVGHMSFGLFTAVFYALLHPNGGSGWLF